MVLTDVWSALEAWKQLGAERVLEASDQEEVRRIRSVDRVGNLVGVQARAFGDLPELAVLDSGAESGSELGNPPLRRAVIIMANHAVTIWHRRAAWRNRYRLLSQSDTPSAASSRAIAYRSGQLVPFK
ncbi:hypothetical protein [Agromyces indicus]|uniref:Uncharacterized protein n=1 Tax=Agromyces indicus TaxID=758919 RepID=A0ABU1FJA9_9MICO|nr:hypothetical protein [Agromyces indicus]MDR5691829.1 hypothetical protein [Agromyces indicus]